MKHDTFNIGKKEHYLQGVQKLPRWRNGSVFVLHANGSGSIPLRGTKIKLGSLTVTD